jgi:hypothetical protein
MGSGRTGGAQQKGTDHARTVSTHFPPGHWASALVVGTDAPAAVAQSGAVATESGAGNGQLSADGSDSLVAYVSNLQSGEITVLRGEREAVVHDPALTLSLARIAG